MDGHGDDMKDSNLSQGACVREDEVTTTLTEENERDAQWMWLQVYASCGATQA